MVTGTPCASARRVRASSSSGVGSPATMRISTSAAEARLHVHPPRRCQKYGLHRQLLRELLGQHAADGDWTDRRSRRASSRTARSDAGCLVHDGAQARPARRRPRSERARHARGCSGRTPISTRFVTIEEPPTVTNGSGIPVTGATPMVMPTFTNTCKRNPNTSPPATTTPYRSPAAATTRSPRQTTSR